MLKKAVSSIKFLMFVDRVLGLIVYNYSEKYRKLVAR